MTEPHEETAAPDVTIGPPASAAPGQIPPKPIVSEPPLPKPPSPEPPSPEPFPPEPPPPSPSSQPQRIPDYRAVALCLAAALILVIVLVGTAPFWAPALPWSTPPAPEAAPRDDAALNQRLDRLDASQQQMRQQTTGAAATLQQLDRRLAAIEAKPPPPPPDTSGIRQQLTSLSGASAALAARVDALDKSVRSRNEHDTTDMSLVLALLQIRDAVDAGRPFDAEYGALTTLARSRPDVVTAAAPLAEPARTGTASRAVLTRRLRELGGEIAATEAPPAASEGWFGEAWARVRGLIRIRRIDGAAPGGSPDAAVNAAELSLAGGDLEGAVTALGKLDGAAAEAAGPWLRQARQRIAVEAALHRIESLLLAGGPSGASSGTSPGAPPAPPPAMGSAH